MVQTASSSADGGTNTVTVTLSDGTTSTFNIKNGSKGSKGDTGSTGATGNGISSIEILYATSTSNTTAPSTWYTSIQAAAAGSYLWTRVRLLYTNGNYSNPYYTVARQGANGSDATVIVDSSLSDTSTNPVQNKVVKAALDNLTQIVAPLSVRDTDDTTEIDIDHIIAEQDLEVIGETYLDDDVHMENNKKIYGRITLYDPVTVNNDLVFANDPAFCGFTGLGNLCAYLFNLIYEAKSRGWDQSLPGE